MPKVNRLTSKQEAFAREYLKDPTSIEKAALAAGYSPSYAKHRAHELVGKSWMKKALARLREKADDQAIMEVKERKQILSAIARGKVTDFLKLTGGQPVVTLDENGPTTPALASFKVTVNKLGDVSHEFRLRDPAGAIDLLNKMGGDYAPQAVHVTSEMDQMTDAQLAALAKGTAQG